MFENLYPSSLPPVERLAGVLALAKRYEEADGRDAERMKICARWRAAGATPAMRERYYLQQLQLIAGEPLQ